MPSARARASFEPIPPDFDLKALVEETSHFQYVDRISCDMIDQQGIEAFDKLVLLHVIIGGKPLVIDGYDSRLDEWTFSSKWLQDNHGAKVETARNITKAESLPLTIGHYLKNMGKLTDQYFERPDNHKDKDRQRIYLKDIDPPPVWVDKLKEQLPPNLFYFNESCGEFGGPGADLEKYPTGGTRRGRGIAPAGDLMSSLPSQMRAENIMCYIGHEGTYTPAHREMCASLGHNIMVENSNLLGDDGKPEKPGSSIWFMTESKDRQTVAEYWLSILGHDIEVEKHFAQIAAWKKAPFTVYVCEQRAGDFILIPPLAPHQVWNRGTRTMKVAWNRTTVETLEMAMNEALPKAKMVCRDEQYKNKAIVYYTLHKYESLLNKWRDLLRTAPSPQEQNTLRNSPKIRQLQKDFKRLLRLFRDMLLSEMFAPDSTERKVQFLPFDGNVTCAYCRGNIFNRFLSCPSCELALGTEQAEPYDICMDCYAMGRSCACISKLTWTEQFKWKDLIARYETWRRLYIELDNGRALEGTPLTIQEERAKYPKNTLAQICQYQLKRRPWIDIAKPPSEDEGSESEENDQIEYAEDGTIKKKKHKKKRTEAWFKNNRPCHVCAHRHPRWKMAECTCGRCWCYGTLFRGHDVMPQTVMEDPNWKCPHCQGICSAGNCRRDPRQKPYEPKGTLLGHDTRAVADVRSVESLVDFSVSNLTWLKESVEIPAENARLRKKAEEAQRAKNHDTAHLNEQHYANEEDAAQDATVMDRSGIEYSPERTGTLVEPGVSHNEPSFIDPSLLGDETQQPAEESLLPVAALLNREREPDDSHNPNEGYRPAHQSGFVAPHAVMYGENADTASAERPAAAETGGDATGNRTKLTAEQLAAIKARMTAKANARRESGPVSGATKQYRKEYERRALEEARRKGRFIQVSAALKGKTKVIRLRISSSRLRHFRNIVQNPTNDLLRSDVQPQDPQAASGSKPTGYAARKEKAVRVLTEHDDDFRTRKRKRGPQKPRNQARDVEEIDLPSDPEEEADEAATQEGALEVTDGGRKRRRVSQWQARRAAEGGDDNVDAEADGGEEPSPKAIDGRKTKALPLRDSKGSFIKSSKIRPSQPLTKRTPKPAGKTTTQNSNSKLAGKSPAIRPSERPVSQVDGTVEVSSDSSSSDEEEGLFSSVRSTAAKAINSMSSVFNGQATDQDGANRRAKLEAAGMLDNVDHGSEDEDEGEEDGAFVKPVATSSATNGIQKAGPPTSILDRRNGPGNGKRIKIVGSKKR
ncbi:MAG: hypothetical protein Q9159_002238 [Coniocarpon cinnabarinum]